jgi:hypothetical protein
MLETRAQATVRVACNIPNPTVYAVVTHTGLLLEIASSKVLRPGELFNMTFAAVVAIVVKVFLVSW